MKFKKTLLVFCLIICVLFCVSSVAAGDVNDAAIASENQNIIENQDLVAASEATVEVDDKKIESDVISSSNEENLNAKDNGTFTALQEKINNAGENTTITLENDYIYDEGFSTNGIRVSKSLTIDGNNHILDAKSKAGIFQLISSNNIVLKNMILIGGHAIGGAIYIYNGDNCSMISCNFTNCSSTTSYYGYGGGAIYINNGDNCSMISCDFVNCYANRDGGAIYINGDNCAISSCDFVNCSATNRGGAIYNYGADCIISSCNFTDCYTSTRRIASWGAIEGRFTEDNCKYKDTNLKKDSFGYLSYLIETAEAGSTITLDKDYIYDEGFALYGIIVSKSLTIDGNNHILDAKSKARIFQLSSNNIVLKNMILIGGHAVGGAIYINGDNCSMISCNFTNCNGRDGGAIYINGDNCSMISCDFVNCYAGQYGGAIYNSGDNCIISYCDFTNCYAGVGGAIYNSWAVNCTISSCNFTNCTDNDPDFSYHAGAIYNSGDNCIISSCDFTDCSATGHDSYFSSGGAIYNSGDNCIISSCDFTDCSAPDYDYFSSGAAIYNSGDNCIISSCNFTDCYTSTRKVTSWGAIGGKVTEDNCRYNDVNLEKDSFGYLYYLIETAEAGSTITLDKDYTCNERFPTEGIRVSKSLTIDGNNHILDAKSKARIFNLNSNNIVLKNMILIGGNAVGGAIYINGDNCTISSCNFTNCSSTASYGAGGGAIYISGVNCIISSCDFTNCYAGVGGAIYNSRSDNCTISSCNFTNCYGIDGGAIYICVNCTISSCDFMDCNAREYGGAIYISGVNCIIGSCDFMDCNAREYGGAIYSNGANCIISSCDFTDCYTEVKKVTNWGAIEGRFTEDNCKYKDTNLKKDSFGYLSYLIETAEAGSTITLDKDYTYDEGFTTRGIRVSKSLTIDGNNHILDAKSKAGIFFLSSNNIVLKNMILIGGSYSGDGGAIYISGANCTMSSCNFTNCSSTASYGAGGAIYISGDNCTMSSCDFMDCNAGEYGGAIYISGVNCIIGSCDFMDCNAGEYGGAIYSNGANCTISSCDFTNCYANRDGGAIMMYSRENCSILYCNFINCYTAEINTTGEGAIFIKAGNVTVKNCTYIDSDAIATVIVSSPVTTVYNGGKYLIATLKDSEGNALSGFEVSVDFNGVKTLTTDTNGQVKVSTIGLIPKTYDVLIIFAGNENYAASNTTTQVVINKDSAKLTASEVTTVYNVDKDLVVTLTDSLGNALSGFDISVDLNGVKTLTTDTNGQVKVSTIGLIPKTYDVLIIFAGNENYTASNTTTQVVINKDSTKLTASAVTTVYNVNKNLVITLKDSQGKALSGVKVSVNINGAKTYTTKNGQVKIAVGSLAPKTYTAKISFAGNDNYNATSANVKVTVKKATPKLTAKAKTFKKSVKTKKYSITLKTNQNKVMKNTVVTLKVNGKTYSAKTNTKGQATFKITKLTKKGKFTAVVKFAGNKYYNAKTVKPKIIVK